jgi:hypothetical protein
MHMGSKGQMFLIAAVVIVAAIVVLGFNMTSSSATKEAEAMKATFETDMFGNVLNEFNATMDVSANAPENVTSNTVDFSSFAQANLAGRSMTLKLLFVGTVANKTLQTLNVTVLDMLGYAVNASLEANGQTASNASVANNGRWDASFTITSGSTYLMNITYNAAGASGTTETIAVQTKKNKDTYTGFFYVIMSGSSSNHVSKYQKYIMLK